MLQLRSNLSLSSQMPKTKIISNTAVGMRHLRLSSLSATVPEVVSRRTDREEVIAPQSCTSATSESKEISNDTSDSQVPKTEATMMVITEVGTRYTGPDMACFSEDTD